MAVLKVGGKGILPFVSLLLIAGGLMVVAAGPPGGGDSGGLVRMERQPVPTPPTEPNTDRPGSDYRQFDLPVAGSSQCRDACVKDGRCLAWTYVKPGFRGPSSRCYLKNAVPDPVPNTCCESGTLAARETQKFDFISSESPAPGVVVWRIDRPNLRAHQTDYRNITFQPGDVLTIRAGGYANHGGTGPTCKRYVNPVAWMPKRQNLYHGLVWIPGLTTGLQPVKDYRNRTLTVPGGVPADQLYVRLGYEDDGYGDNSYTYDEGWRNQCEPLRGEPAWVEITVRRAAAPPVPSGPPRLGREADRTARPSTSEVNTDRPGLDYFRFWNVPSAAACSTECLRDGKCRAWTYVKPGLQGATSRCFLKDGVPPPVSNSCCESGVVPEHAVRPPPEPPLDLVWEKLDANLAPLNPRWRWQVLHPYLPDPRDLKACEHPSLGEWAACRRIALAYYPDPSSIPECTIPREGFRPNTAACTSQAVTEDRAPGLCPTGEGGHFNWGAATYEGPIYWSDTATADQDLNFTLHSPEGAGATIGRPGKIHLEMAAPETVKHVDDQHSAWWRAFRRAVMSGIVVKPKWEAEGPAGALVHGQQGIVTGLFNLDCAHNCDTELHPIWAMAIQTRNDASDETWAIMVRNWGNEGYCSRHQHYLDLPTGASGDYLYTFHLPWRPGSSAVNVLDGTVFRSNNRRVAIEMSYVVGEAVALVFHLPRPEEHPRVMGEVRLGWTSAATKFAGPRPVVTGSLPASAQQEEETTEDRLERFVSRLPQEKQLRVSTALNGILGRGPIEASFETSLPAARRLAAFPASTARLRGAVTPLRSRSVLDPEKAKTDELLLEALVDAGVTSSDATAHYPPLADALRRMEAQRKRIVR